MTRAPGPEPHAPAARPWWAGTPLWCAMALVAIVPFLFATILPFNDLPNHVARHYVFLNAASDPFLRGFYAVKWRLIGNLGVDLPVWAMGGVLGAELATRVVVGAIPVLTLAGIYALGRAYHGTVPPGAILAAVLIFNWPLLTGFTNFSLAAAIALLTLALWIRLRALPFPARLAIFFPLAFVTWLAHTAGWGLLCLGVGSFELARATSLRWSLRRVLMAPLQASPFALMIVPIVLWRRAAGNGAAVVMGDDFLYGKVVSAIALFREQYLLWDMATAGAYVALTACFFLLGGRRVAHAAALTAAVFLVAFLICPTEIFKSGFADRRLLTYGAMFVPLAIGVRADVARGSSRASRWLSIAAGCALVLFVARVAVTTVGWARASAAHEKRLALINAVPPHSRLFALDVESCTKRWNRVGRPDHLQQYALPRRRSVVNGMYQNPGLNQVETLAPPVAGFDLNMYPTVHDESCPVPYIPLTYQEAMRRFPRDRFDYVWIIADDPLRPADMRGLAPVAASDNDRLYRVVR